MDHVPGDMTKKQQAALAVKLQQFNEWRMADPDIAETAAVAEGAARLRRAPAGAPLDPTRTGTAGGAHRWLTIRK